MTLNLTLLQRARAIVTAYTNPEWNESRRDNHLEYYEPDSKVYCAALILMHYYKHPVQALVLATKVATLYGSNFKPGLQEGLHQVNISLNSSNHLPTLAQVANFLAGLQVVTMGSENDLQKETETMHLRLFKNQ